VTGLAHQGRRYILLGSANTAASFVLLAGLAQVLDHRVAYTVAFAAGVIFTTLLTGRFVFSAAGSRGKSAAFACWYVGAYFAGLLAVHVIDSGGDRSGLVVALGAILVTAPLGFLGGRIIYHDSSSVVGSGALR
jgi:putative flippase GtrA